MQGLPSTSPKAPQEATRGGGRRVLGKLRHRRSGGPVSQAPTLLGTSGSCFLSGSQEPSNLSVDADVFNMGASLGVAGSSPLLRGSQTSEGKRGLAQTMPDYEDSPGLACLRTRRKGPVRSSPTASPLTQTDIRLVGTVTILGVSSYRSTGCPRDLMIKMKINGYLKAALCLGAVSSCTCPSAPPTTPLPSC